MKSHQRTTWPFPDRFRPHSPWQRPWSLSLPRLGSPEKPGSLQWTLSQDWRWSFWRLPAMWHQPECSSATVSAWTSLNCYQSGPDLLHLSWEPSESEWRDPCRRAALSPPSSRSVWSSCSWRSCPVPVSAWCSTLPSIAAAPCGKTCHHHSAWWMPWRSLAEQPRWCAFHSQWDLRTKYSTKLSHWRAEVPVARSTSNSSCRPLSISSDWFHRWTLCHAWHHKISRSARQWCSCRSRSGLPGQLTDLARCKGWSFWVRTGFGMDIWSRGSWIRFCLGEDSHDLAVWDRSRMAPQWYQRWVWLQILLSTAKAIERWKLRTQWSQRTPHSTQCRHLPLTCCQTYSQR